MRNTIIKKTIICSLFVLFFFSGNAQKITMNQGNTVQQNYYTEIPFEYVNSKIIIPVVIHNKTYRFLLDTGAPNCITQRLKNELNATLVKQLPVTDANNNKSVMDIVTLPELSIGGVTFQNTVALAYREEKNIVFDCFAIDGFIGSNLLRNSILQIDIKNKLVRITNDLEKIAINKKNVTKVALLGNQSNPFIWIKINGEKSVKEQVLIDTGMKGFYDLSNRAYNIFKNKTEIKVLSKGNGSNSIGLFDNTKSSEQLRLLVPEITISKTKFTAITTTTTDDKNSRIGIDFLEYGIGTIDYQNKKFYFSAYSDTNNLSEVLQPFSPTILNNQLSVGIVWDENLKNKITSGDEILEMNDVNYQQYEICDLITKPSIFKNLIIKVLVIKRADGSILKVTL
jgi:predicted aspartyl protease